MRKLLPLLVLMFAIALTAPAQNRMSPERAAGIKADLAGQIDGMKKQAQVMSDTVFSFGELGFQEFETSKYLSGILEKEGFKIERGVAGIPTAFVATWGQGKPVIALGSDIDDIPQASQKPGIPYHAPMIEGAPGHGEGHNSGMPLNIVAALAVKKVMEREHLTGTLKLWPGVAEELLGSKAFYVRAGLFKDVDVVLFAHVGDNLRVTSGPGNQTGMVSVEYTFKGETAHAAGAPWRGRSALDAVELMNVGVNYMREHMPSDARVHYAILDAGGIAPNVVQARAKVRYLIRARELPELTRLIARVRKIADGAALMTETRVESQVVSAVSNLLANTPLERAMHDNLQRIGPPPFDDADRAAAAKFQATLTDEDIEAAYRRAGVPVQPDTPLCNLIVPLDAKSAPMMGSTDVGDVSWVVPTVQARGATYAIGTPGHSWQLTAQGKLPAAHKGLVHVAKVMAGTAIDVIQDEVLLARAKADHQARVARNPYVCPLPDDLEPPIKMSA
jgi:aminobenzoyl-glutamate utilization protein B